MPPTAGFANHGQSNLTRESMNDPDDDRTDAFGRFFLPGPTEVRAPVLAAQDRPVIGHRGPEILVPLEALLVPVGFLNEVHEPPTFYGVERNPVEKNVIPTTWWEGGIGISSRWPFAIGTQSASTA